MQSILTLVLQVLGITVEALWTKLGQHIGPDRVAMIRSTIDRLEGAWAFIKDVQENGIAAVWRYVTDQLSGLWDTLLNMAQEWIMTTVIQRVTAKLISMLDPTGIMAVVNSFIAFFNAVQSAIEYLRDILTIINQWVTTIAQVAAGNIVPGAQMLEQGLAAAVPVAIGFLANQVGLGNIPEKVVEIIGGLRQLVDQALDWLIGGAVRLGQAALGALGVGAGPGAPPGAADDIRAQARAAVLAELRGDHTIEEAGPIVAAIEGRLRPGGLRRLALDPPAEDGSVRIVAEASPGLPLAKLIPKGTVPTGRTVRAVAEITLSTAASVTERRLPATDPARQPHGGAVLSQPGVVRVAGWNTGALNTHDNATHAEHQVCNFIENERIGSELMARSIQQINVNIINYSPCSTCSGELAHTLGFVARTRGLTFVGTNGAQLAWRDHYPGFGGGINATTWQNIGDLRRAGWNLRAPASGHPQPDPATGRQSAGYHEWKHEIQPL